MCVCVCVCVYFEKYIYFSLKKRPCLPNTKRTNQFNRDSTDTFDLVRLSIQLRQFSWLLFNMK